MRKISRQHTIRSVVWLLLPAFSQVYCVCNLLRKRTKLKFGYAELQRTLYFLEISKPLKRHCTFFLNQDNRKNDLWESSYPLQEPGYKAEIPGDKHSLERKVPEKDKASPSLLFCLK